MAAQERIIFTVTPEEYQWFVRLAEYAGGTRIELFRALLDAYAKQIKFEPRPGSKR